MPKIRLKLECPVHESFRVAQLSGMFDVPPAEKLTRSWDVELPGTDEDWSIGLIVGPSGSGKSSIARAAWPSALAVDDPWPTDRAVVDGFGDRDVRTVTQALTAVGFSSPPSWLKPYHVLSNGEKFRCDLARALVTSPRFVVFDEFTSVVDRTVAKIGSAAVAKAIRGGKIKRRFVAVTCHYDIAEWLEPDWVLDMASGELARGRLRRPTIELQIAPVHRSAWVLFRDHHYLSANLSRAARAFVAFWGETPVAFSAWLNMLHPKRRGGDMREHRTVVLPDYQGLGIGNRLSEFCASLYKGLGARVNSTTSHPSMIRHRSASPLWLRQRLGFVTGGGAKAKASLTPSHSSDRVTGGFEYVGPGLPAEQARAILAGGARPLRFDGLAAVVLAEIERTPGAAMSLLIRRSGASDSAVRRVLAELVDAGAIQPHGGGRGTTSYTLADRD